MTGIIEQFCDDMRSAGIEPPDVIGADGKLHRFSTNGSTADDAGWYILHNDSSPAGMFGCWRDGIKRPWSSRKLSEMTSAERDAYEHKITECARQRSIERERRRLEAGKRAENIWRDAKPETGEHRYLRDKGVQAYGIRTDGQRLVIPKHDTRGQLHGLQFISPDGTKRSLSGGCMSGCYHAIGKPNSTLYIAEGYATAASIYAATGHGVAVAFDAGGLKPVAQALRAKYPDLQLVICADNDIKPGEPNTGIEKARKAAQTTGASVAIPEMGDRKCDFNDFFQAYGAEAVQRAIEHAQSPGLSESAGLSAESVSLGAANVSDWPEPLGEPAYHGLAGEIVRTIQPHTESHPVAILVQLLTAFGNCIGIKPHYRVESTKHRANLFIVLVGNTSKARKGTSWGRVEQLFRLVDNRWAEHCTDSGLNSGEGLIWAVRDPVTKGVRKGKGADSYLEDEVVDAGISDKRRLVIEEELASTLRVMDREGNTLSPLLRKAWDGHRLSSLTKNSPAVATGAHISIVGHITVDELRRYLCRTEMGNGFANRFLYLCVRRSNILPDGGNLADDALVPFAERLTQVVTAVRTIERVTMDDDAKAIWHAVYPDLSAGLPGLVGATTSRAEAQVIRLALLYALLDESRVIQPAHLRAALAVWEYVEVSARYIFGSAVGDPVADDILRSLRANPDGLSRTNISELFKRHKNRETIGLALDSLAQKKLAKSEQRKTEGRPVEVWRAC